MTDDLVTRLRSARSDDCGNDVLCDQAADLIEKQAAEVLDLRAKLAEAEKALEQLSCLGNGDRPGNSDGNTIARAALAKVFDRHSHVGLLLAAERWLSQAAGDMHAAHPTPEAPS